jgi:uncharacterized membrane protein YbhN (UPF0104 family)
VSKPRLFVRTAVSVIIAIVLLTLIPIEAVWDSLRRVRSWVWLASLGVFFSGHYLNALKLRLIIRPASVPVAACVRAQYAGLAANLSLPGLAGGDVVRAAYLAQTAGITRVVVASLVDRLLDAMVLVLVIAVALPLAGVPPIIASLVGRAGWWIAGLTLAGLLLAGLGTLVLMRLGLWRHIEQARMELRNRSSAIVGAMAIALLVQPAFVLTNVWLAREVGVTVGVAAWFVAWPASKLTAILPISLGGIGVREAALVALLAPYGAPTNGVMATGILWESVLVVGAIVGLIATLFFGRHASDAVRSSEGQA